LCVMNSLLKVRQLIKIFIRRFWDVCGMRYEKEWTEMLTAGSWLIHDNNAPAGTALLIRQFLTKHSIPTLPQPHLFTCLLPSQLFPVP
jgi:hypothetical protein